MTASQLKRRQQKRSTDTLRKSFDDVSEAVNDLADALDAGEADEESVAETVRHLAGSMAAIEDAAETADVIDAESAEWRAINELRASMYHAANAIELKGTSETDAVISPTAADSRSAALSDASAAAEYLELARDAERGSNE